MHAAQHGRSKPTFDLGALVSTALQVHINRTMSKPPSKVCTAINLACAAAQFSMSSVWSPNMLSALMDASVGLKILGCLSPTWHCCTAADVEPRQQADLLTNVQMCRRVHQWHSVTSCCPAGGGQADGSSQ